MNTINTSKPSKPKALIFDSGVGGLSVCDAIKQKLDITIEFISDTDFFPYGNKEPDIIINRVTTLLEKEVAKKQPDIIVIACNTASTLALEPARQLISKPIVGVVPAIKTASQLTQSNCIGLLATPRTVNGIYTDQLIKEFAEDVTVIKLGSAELVETIEQHINGGKLDTRLVHSLVEQMESTAQPKEIDTVVLGCTHFPLIRDVFVSIKPDWQWIDSGDAIARRVAHLLELHN